MDEIFALSLQAEIGNGGRKEIYVTKNGRFL